MSRWFLLGLATALAFVAVGCSDDDDTAVEDAVVETEPTAATDEEPPDAMDSEPAEAAGDGTAEVTVVDLSFAPDTITVEAGTEVVWTNEDGVTHTVTAEDASPMAFDSGDLDPGEAFSQTFDEPGEYPYFCTIHPQMGATVIVQ